MSEGFFTIERELLEHPIWMEEPFTKGQAWVDLIGRANFKSRERFYGGRCITIERGQLIVSHKGLASRWRWSEHKVRNYLRALTEAKMVSVEGTPLGTLITVENYTKYQRQGRASGSTEGQTIDVQRACAGRAEGRHKNKDKNDKNDNKGNNTRARARVSPRDDEWGDIIDPDDL